MPNGIIEESNLQNIATAIRNKNGLTTSYTVSSMVGAINAFTKTGYNMNDVAQKRIAGNISGSASLISDYAFYNCSALTTISFPNCTSIGSYAFQSCSALTTVSFPSCTFIGSYAFYSCRTLTTANFPVCTSIGNSGFYNCSSLTTASFPVCTSIGSSAFRDCRVLTTASFPMCTNIGGQAFQYCYRLISLYLNSVTQVPTLGATAFSSTPIGGYSTTAGRYGSVFVPASLYNSFLTATNWSSISARIVSV